MKSAAAPRGLKRPILPILVSWSTPHSTVMLLNAANPCPHWLLDAPTPHPPASPTSKADKPPTPATRRPTSHVQHSTQKKPPYTHATQICCEQKKQDKSLVQQIQDSHSIMHTATASPPPRPDPCNSHPNLGVLKFGVAATCCRHRTNWVAHQLGQTPIKSEIWFANHDLAAWSRSNCFFRVRCDGRGRREEKSQSTGPTGSSAGSSVNY